MRPPGFLLHLQQDFETLPLDLLKRIDRAGGLEVQGIFDALLRPIDHTICDPEPLDPAAMSTRPYAGNVAVMTYSPDMVGVACSTTEDPRRIIQLHHHETPLLTPQHAIHRPATLVPCGSGDILPMLVERGLIDTWRSEGIEHLYVTADPRVNWDLVQDHVASEAAVTCHVRPAVGSDSVLVGMHAGVGQLMSRFRIQLTDPVEDPAARLGWAWSGSAVIDIRIDPAEVQHRWHRRSRVVDGQIVYSLYRAFEDVTATYRTRFVR